MEIYVVDFLKIKNLYAELFLFEKQRSVVFIIHPRNIQNRNTLWAFHFAGFRIGTVTEKFAIHLGNHIQHTFASFFFPLWQECHMRDLCRSK